MKRYRKLTWSAAIVIFLGLLIAAVYIVKQNKPPHNQLLEDILPYSGVPYTVLKDNQPDFTQKDMTTDSFEWYGNLDKMGRCTVTMANVSRDTMPTEPRGEIGSVKPTGWTLTKYDFIDGKYLYNRCHLIGFQLTGENANERNLITGTRYMNVEGMLPFENMVADYVKETGNHVLYRVTAVFDGYNLVADGVEMEAYSVEDQGKGICFHVFVYNVQPGVIINYASGESHIDENYTPVITKTYVLNTLSRKFHMPDCPDVNSIGKANLGTCTGNREQLIAQGYSPCKQCNP